MSERTMVRQTHHKMVRPFDKLPSGLSSSSPSLRVEDLRVEDRASKLTIMVYRNLKSPLGEMIAGATDDGVCFLEWHDRGGIDRIKQRVTKRYKVTLQEGNNRHLDQLERELEGYFAGTLKKFKVPIAVTGTMFEKKTWEKLLLIPYGQTRSYSQIASLLGKPEARRAVGRANGANYLSIVIPCHRVIESNGNLRGYGGKLWRKKYLLELEQGLKPLIPTTQ